MSTGKTRLEDMHKAKRKATSGVRNELLAKIDAEIAQEKTDAQKKLSSPCVIKKFRKDPQLLTPDEQLFYDQIVSQLKELYAESARYDLVSKMLAKIYGLQKRLADQMEVDGGPIVTTGTGRLYPHPALKFILQNNVQILAALRQMGLTPVSAAKTGDDAAKSGAFISEFAQFQQ